MPFSSEALTKKFKGMFNEQTARAEQAKFNKWFAEQYAFISTRQSAGNPTTKPGFYNGRVVRPGSKTGGFPGLTGLQVIYRNSFRLFDEKIQGTADIFRADWEAMTKGEYDDYLRRSGLVDGAADQLADSDGVSMPLAV